MDQASPLPEPDPEPPRRCFQCDGTGVYRTLYRLEYCHCDKGCASVVPRGLTSY